jgi:hypothetical protein
MWISLTFSHDAMEGDGMYCVEHKPKPLKKDTESVAARRR